MNSYLIIKPFEAKAPTGNKIWKGGEAIRLPSTKAASMVVHGVIVEQNVGMHLMNKYEARAKVLMTELGYSRKDTLTEASQMVASCLKRHESTKTLADPTEEFLAEVEEFNRKVTGKNPVLKEKSDTGVGEWAGFTCNIGTGCSHGCRYCYAEKMAVRFKQVASPQAWQEESLRAVSTTGCKKYDATIMFPPLPVNL